jgi:uncharacterized coiled-coil protein SlyX
MDRRIARNSLIVLLGFGEGDHEMTIEERMNKLEKAFGANDALVRELRDAVTVTAQLEARQGRVVKEHGEWLAAHQQAMREHDERMKTLDERIANLVSGIGEFMRRGNQGGFGDRG